MNLVDLLTIYGTHNQAFDEQAFCGRWYVVATSLNVWQKRSNPSITYTPLETNGTLRLLDDVAYGSAQKPRHIIGFDQQEQRQPRIFTWRGKSWYSRWITSNWCVVDNDAACTQWAITYFSKTVVTAAGVDIYARQPTLEPGTLACVRTKFKQHPMLGQFTLFAPHHDM